MRKSRMRLRHVRTRPHIFFEAGKWTYLACIDNFAICVSEDAGWMNKQAKGFCFDRNNACTYSR